MFRLLQNRERLKLVTELQVLLFLGGFSNPCPYSFIFNESQALKCLSGLCVTESTTKTNPFVKCKS